MVKNVAKLFVECLEAHNVEYVFGVPGEENLDLLDALRESSIKIVVTRHEQTAVFMAATHGRLTGKVGVAMATLWPWATNMMTGVAYAQLGWMPVMVISWQKPIKKSKQWRFQILDVVSMMKPVTKFATTIVNAAKVSSTIADAIMTAEAEKPWAVHIELPEDIAREDASGLVPIVFDKIRRPIADEKAINEIVSYLEKAHRPMILVWAWANRKRVTKYLTKFIQKHNIPFFTSQMGKWVVDERLPQYIGTAALTSNDYIHDVIDQADLLIAVGHDTIEKPTNVVHDGKTKVVHINFTPAQVDELYKPNLQVPWDIGNTLWRLYESEIDTSWWGFDSIYETALKARSMMEANTDTICCTQGVTPARFIRELRKNIEDDAIVALDNWLYKVRFARNFPTYSPNTLLLDNALATMWAWYSSAMMAKILHENQQVIAVVWDWGLLMNLGDLETIVRLWLDMTIIVLNDSAYGMIKWKQSAMWLASFGLDLTNPDFVWLAESFGAKWYSLDAWNNFHEVMQSAFAQTWLKIIEVKIMYPEKVA